MKKLQTEEQNSLIHLVLFKYWLLSSWHITCIPDLICVKRTADSVLFACCPPLPLERNVSTSHSDKRASSESGICIKLKF